MIFKMNYNFRGYNLFSPKRSVHVFLCLAIFLATASRATVAIGNVTMTTVASGNVTLAESVALATVANGNVTWDESVSLATAQRNASAALVDTLMTLAVSRSRVRPRMPTTSDVTQHATPVALYVGIRSVRSPLWKSFFQHNLQNLEGSSTT